MFGWLKHKPQQSTDEGPLVGWSKRPRSDAPASAAHAPDADGGAAVAAAIDAGAAMPSPVPTAADGGADATHARPFGTTG